jgi:hypothetical protein
VADEEEMEVETGQEQASDAEPAVVPPPPPPPAAPSALEPAAG